MAGFIGLLGFAPVDPMPHCDPDCTFDPARVRQRVDAGATLPECDAQWLMGLNAEAIKRLAAVEAKASKPARKAISIHPR